MTALEHKSLPVLTFADQAAFEAWLCKMHDKCEGVWLRYYKKHTGMAGMSHDEAIDSALCWGWIDGLINRFDESSYLVRFTPRRPKSVWSKINVAKVEHLIEQGRMKPSGLKVVTEAKANGRWQAAYAGQASITVPEAFLHLIATDAEAETFYLGLSKANRYAIAFRIETAVGINAKQKMMEKIFAMLKARQSFHA